MEPTWLPAVLVRIRELAAQRKVQFTLKALQELAALDVGLDEEDACDVLASLDAGEFAERLRSKSTGEWMYVFKPEVGSVRVYLKIVLRLDGVVISFHEDKEQSHEDK